MKKIWLGILLFLALLIAIGLIFSWHTAYLTLVLGIAAAIYYGAAWVYYQIFIGEVDLLTPLPL
ncbi:TPA: hypothetical protein DIU27_01240 [Candidatus Collierbacteria bacterium]|uniref:Uncharacterized protein n=1 Tax=Candidatus Collierbacteria bacterium GW2011_GWB2_44_22 TaxID=1618387 RepID=A0A0G1KTE7_9BACT|nr:MAG: hypothetical protein UW31_C0012G0035 [Candidatus Collierbacteria bacterium GW2011_GWA2_44_13]KKT51149.1 MAG: hypothetical protein UW44_C0015G0020 [Candidatus Collierbacteria bacterium GW2011_GWB2_44_22]KKT64111.1 MAG: hypothetical protein UW58_C0050G0006 [Candidatus Collierbacteria bacterium GW2011_GWC2_44_30]KKT68224.1 MAG: hypothetical protein UW64_C0026G0013 [Microgenomates group bacterium GW2011_GWC1_44_37]KKT88171.1 MAG: hypothetical protein UW88_C0014G0036 [Candidatus Collierbacte